MFRHVIPFLVLVAFFGGVFLIFANTPLLVNLYGADWIEKQVPGVMVESFSVQGQHFFWPDGLRFFGVKAKVHYHQQDYTFAAGEVNFQGSFRSVSQKEPVRVGLEGASFTTKDVTMSDTRLRLEFPVEVLRKKVFQGTGRISVGDIRFRQYDAQQLQVKFRVTKEEFQILEASAALYGGNFQSGQISFKFRPSSLYISWSELKGLDATQLAGFNPVLFSGLRGRIDGTWRLAGTTKNIEVLAIILTMPEGGDISPSQIRRLADALPDSETRQKFLSLAQSEQPLPFQAGSLHIQNVDFQTIALIIDLQFPRHDLHIQERIFVPAPQGLTSLLIEP